MKLTQLGQTDLQVNPIGFGGIPIQRLSHQESDEIIQKAIQKGINFFDTSRVYTDSEEKLGRVFAQHPREKIIIASKTYSRETNLARTDLEMCLKLMKTDYIDLYQCHNVSNPDDLDKLLAPGGVLEMLQQAQQEGKVRHIGITSHKPPVLVPALEKFPFATIQVPLNYIEQGCLQELVPLARKKKIGVIAMKPVAGGAFKNAVLSLRFILANGADVVIPGMDALNQVEENLKAIETDAPLTTREIALLQEEKDLLGEKFCRRCEYCMPCPQGLPIAFLHILRAYYLRYNLKEWSLERVNALPKSYKDCNGCNSCVKKCPYDLDSPGIFKETWEIMNPCNPA